MVPVSLRDSVWAKDAKNFPALKYQWWGLGKELILQMDKGSASWTLLELGDSSFGLIFLAFYTIHDVLTASILWWFAIPSSSGSRFVRTLCYDLSILVGSALHGSWLHWVTKPLCHDKVGMVHPSSQEGWYQFPRRVVPVPKKSESESHSVMSNSLRPHGLYSPQNSPGQNTGVGSLSLLQGIFQHKDQTQVSCIIDRLFTSWATREAQVYWNG